MKRLRKFLGLPTHLKLLFLAAVFLIAISILFLRIFLFPHVQRFVANKKIGRPSRISSLQIVRAVQAAALLFRKGNCLPQALVALYLLKINGYGSELKIGVLPDGSRIQAHAWLEQDGRVLIGGAGSPALYQQLVYQGPE